MKLDITDIVAEAPSEQLPDVIARVGSTPLMRLTRIGQHLPDGVQLYAKAEHLNPTGSVKDRAAKGMLLDGLRTGALNDAVTLIDATSGNTGISYAAMGAALGIRVTLAMPSNASAERRLMLQALGAELILTDPMEGTGGAQKHVRELVRRSPERYYYPDQYNNDANWRAHFEGTGLEILDQTDGRVTHFVAALGTTGTFTGVSRRLKEFDTRIRAISVQPDTALHAMEGLKHMESALVPGIYDPHLADEDMSVSTEEAQKM